MSAYPYRQIILTAQDQLLFDAWQKHCGDLPNVTVHRGSILDLECDAVVSPGNSFGFMDGGIDLAYTKFFGPQVQEQLQVQILTRHHGELLVGAAQVVPTGHTRIKYLIAAPTMRVPMILSDTINPYLACRAALLAREHNEFKIGTIAFPGMGTGVGQICPTLCAQQMRAAYEEMYDKDGTCRMHLCRTLPATWDEAQVRHQRLYGGTVRDLQENTECSEFNFFDLLLYKKRSSW